MKLGLYTTWNKKCGIADYALLLTRALEKNGVTVEIVPVRDAKKAKMFIEDGKRLSSADVAHIQHEFSFFTDSRLPIVSPLLSLWHFFLLLSQIKITRIVTLHELQTTDGAVSSILRFQRYLFLKILIALLNKFDLIIVHTDRFRELLIKHGIDSQRVTFLPHPLPKLNDAKIDEQSINHSLYGNETKVLTIFGFVYARKGYEVAISAIEALHDCILLVAGGPLPGDITGYYDDLVNRVNKLNLSQRVKFLGFLSEPELHKVFLNTDIFLAPYFDAAGSGSLSRVAAYQKPIIASDIPTMKELKKIGLGIELFESGNSLDLRSAILRLFGDKERRQQLSQLTTQFIDRHSYDQVAHILKTMYTQKASFHRFN